MRPVRRRCSSSCGGCCSISARAGAYDFGGQGELAGVATLEMQDGGQIELRRRKGNKDKVSIKRDGQPTDLDHAGWLRLLDHADRDLFESVFAFGLDQLSQGESSLKHESLQSALFGGGLGGTTSPDKVLAEFAGRRKNCLRKGVPSRQSMGTWPKSSRIIERDQGSLSSPDKYHQIVEFASPSRRTRPDLARASRRVAGASMPR